ncbi:unnamed protein product [Enterobius vermicularis]|uniref:PK_Tyr_Ser-Thr domain-containing protein n=1 Tax=Enterobius vermicularis TaxID=51028 RepID=A0A0N4VD40_ENTVE|nr:unnamed protein product [Enterobius vermicularis]
MVHPKDDWKIYRIWAVPTHFPSSSSKTNCEWTRVSVEIPPQEKPYKIQFVADDLHETTLKLAIDDISMSRNCFRHVLPKEEKVPKKIKKNLTETVHEVLSNKTNAKRTYLAAGMTIYQQNQVAGVLVISLHLYRYLKRRTKQVELEKNEMGLETIKSVQPVNISRNPIYESLGLTSDLRSIPRENITFKDALGQGAFGEVFEGCLVINDRKIAVAIKSLPTTNSKDAVDDFEMEALIMR